MNYDNAKIIWLFLKNKGLNDWSVAGIIGNLYAESGLIPNNVQGSYRQPNQAQYNADYTAKVDRGEIDFVNDKTGGGGFAIAQWTWPARKRNLLNFAKQSGTSIGDLNMQLNFLWQEINQDYKTMLNKLKNVTSVLEASNIILFEFEQPGDQSATVQAQRSKYGEDYYNKYANKTISTQEPTSPPSQSGTTEKQIRELVVSTARKWLGATRGDSRHKEIVDIYNAQKPLPVSYKVTYTDAWCATFVTTVGLQLGFSDIILPECGCIRMIDLYKKHTNSKWTEQDSFVPQLGDIIMYDWDDGTSFATNDNLGAVEHVGIVSNIQGNTITVIEGNYDNKVKERTLQVNGRFIRGYCLPAYNLKVSKEESTPEQTIPEQSKPEPTKPTGDNPSNWAKTSTDWAKTMGLFLGDGQGNYDWQGNMTREMAAQILYSFYNKINK